MKTSKAALLCNIALFMIFTFTSALAGGDVERGKALFGDPTLGGGRSGQSCNSCHPDGKNLPKAGAQKELEANINRCIGLALKGKALEPGSKDLADVAAYIRSLK